MKFFNIKENLRILRVLISVIFLSILSYTMLVTYILPSSKYFVDYSSSGEFITGFYERVSPSVAQIYNSPDGNKATGSGVYIADNMIITNHHVIKGAGEKGIVTVITNQGIFHGKILERYPDLDLALVFTFKNKGISAKLGNSSKLKIGNEAISIGASYGMYSTLGVGYVTGLNRFLTLAPYSGIISISTGIMPGNSGGGVFNRKGELIGISHARMKASDNMGFAIPVDLVKEKFKFYLGE